MSADYKARVIYNATIHDITKSEETWRDVLRLAGNIYRYEFDNVVMVYAQRPHASLVADYDTWKKVDRYVKRGSKGICIFKSQALKPWCRYVFDLADTDGRKQELTWNMDDEMLLAYVNDLVKREIIATDEVTDIEVAKDVFKDFTKQEICRIINENRTMYGNEMLTGRVNVDDESKTPEVMEEDIAYKSIFYEVATRCGFDLISEEWDLGSIVNIRREDDIYALGSLVCDVSCTILKEIGSNVKRLERERRMRHGSNQFNVSRGERITLSEHHNGGTGRFNESGQIRTDRNGLSERELSAEVPESGEIRKAGGSASGGGRGSEQHAGYDNGAVFRKAQTEESGINDGNVEDSPARDDGGGGNCATGTREPISLETEQELNKELNELESFGTEREAEYKQASLFDFMEVGKIGSTLTDKEKEQNNKFQYSFIQPKKETVIPHDYIVKTLMHGSGFTGGKKRIYDMFQTEADAKTRAKLIKKEYGQGGVGWPLEGYGLHGYDSFSPKGLRLQWRDEEGEKEGYLSWNAVEAELGVLIMLGEYYTPEVVIDRTDTEEVREEIEDREEVLNEEMVPAEEAFAEEKQILDDFIIPDEAEQMGVPDNIRVMQDAGEDFHLGTWDTKDANDFARTDWNIDAIRLLKEIEADGRAATPEEQKVLSRYVGWGGLAVVFDEKNLPFHSRYLQLKELLSSKEYEAARATVNNAFYTPSVVASVITSAISRFGFHKGNILEPSMGIGNFFGCLPENMRECNRYGVEIDDITGRIARLLYPDAQIQIKGFEETNFPDNFFDVVIGNVPFGDYKVYDPEYNKLNFKIHDYFVAKAIDQTRPGGMVAVITTKGTLDKKNPAVRKYLAERAKLVGAVRLPDSTFMGNAGTQVTTDILFFQKRERKESIEPDWVHLGVTKDGIPVNSYFVEHPELMLGTMEYDKGRFGEASAYTRCVNREEGFNLFESLQRAVDSIHAKIKDFEFVSEEEEKSLADIPANPDVKNYTYAFQDGKLYFRKDSRMFEQKAGDKVMERIKGLHKIRELTRHLIEIQKEGCSEEELADAQKKLNEVYDSFVKKNGYITSKANASAFRDDSDYPLLCSLEKVDEDGVVTKADMFTKQTIRAKADVTKVETAVEALNVSVNEYGYVNIPFMLSIYKPKLQAVKENIAEQTGESTKEISFSEEAIMQLSRERLIEELTGVIFLNPERYNENDRNAGWETADEYLSGNVRDKFRVAKAFATDYPELFGSNVEALKQVQPKDLDASEIEVRIGTTWIEPQDYEQFIYDLLETPRWSRARRTANGNTGITVNLNKFNMEWFIENKSRDKNSVRASKTFGTSRMDAYSIFESTLNLRTITIRDRIDDGDGKFHYEVNKNETMLAREKQNQMKEAFKNWIWEEPERRQKYVDYYNETFNNVRLREYDGSYLEFPGMNPDIQLNSHQKNAVARILMGNNTLLAHCVGAGKSFEMMAAIMEQKRLGLSNKAALVVPKSLVGQTASEFLRLYPSANILVAGEHDFSKARRQQFIARIATGDYDAVIMSHNQFEKIPISAERQKELVNRQIDEISYAIAEMKEQNQERWTVKQMEANKKRLEVQLKELTENVSKDDLITFEEFGIDSIFVDEAHAFKNMSVFSKMNNVSGITGSGSKRAMDMFLKCQYISELNGGRGIVFATGTPISNTMVEMYVMQSFLQKDTLEQLGIYHFDSWAANFGEVTTALELTVEGSGFRFKSRFNKFTNLPELMNIFKEVADVQTKDMLNLDVPSLRDGKYIIVESEPDWYTKQVMEDFVARAERIRNGSVDSSEDNFLKITHEARLLGTDARLLEKDAPDNEDGKLNKVVENIVYEYKKAEEEGIVGTQLVFSDIGTPKATYEKHDLSEEFDVYNYIKEQLVKKGIPEAEIAYIHDAGTDAKKDALFREMRTGVKKVLIGSTDKCGTGVNVQTHLVAMHHVDCPWKPSSIEQREGRGLRQGNENKEVAVYRYVTKETFDAYSWSLVENKQRFISQVMTSKAVSRSCEDIDEATLSYAEIKAVATGNPLIKEKMQLDNDVQRLKLLKASYDSQHYAFQDSFMVKFPKLIAAAKEKLACVKEDVALRDKMKMEVPDFAIKIGGITYTERVDGGTLLLKEVASAKTGMTTKIAEFKGFEVLVEKNFMGVNYLVLKGNAEYKVELSASTVGNMIKLENCFNDLQERIVFLEQKLEDYQRDMEQAKIQYEKPFEYEQELADKLKRQYALNAELDLENKRDDDIPKEEKEQNRVAEKLTEYPSKG